MLRAEKDHKFVAGAADVAGADGEDSVTGFGVLEQKFDGVSHGAPVVNVLVAGLANGGGEGFAGYAGDGQFAGGVDVGEDEDVGLIEGGTEVFPEVLGTGIAMWLEEDQQSIELTASSGFERGTNFGGMVAVVVNDGDVVDGAFDIEAAADAAKFGEAFADEVGRDAEIERHGGSGRGVAYIVDTGRMREAEGAKVFAFVGEAEFAGQAFEANVADNQVGLAGDAISKDGALDTGDDGLDVWLVKTKDGGAIERNAIHKIDEGVLDVFERGVLIEVFAVDGGDHGYDGGEEQKAAVAFVSFDDEIFAAAEASGGTGLIDLAADDEGRIEVCGGKNGSDHGSGGGFAVASPTAMPVFRRMSSASISARGMTGILRL
jgi:hypothetical protein